MKKVCECSEECGKSEIDLFSIPQTQTAIEEGVWDNIKPHPNYGQGTIVFDIPGDSIHYINLSETELWLDVSLQKKNVTSGQNENLDFTDTTNPPKIAPVNNFLHSLFSQVQISLNGKDVENTNSNYAYRSYLENLLSFDRESKETFLGNELFIKDVSDKIANNVTVQPIDATDKNYNSAVLKRRELFKTQPVQLKGRLHCDVFNMNRHLLSNVNITIKLTRNKPEFYLIGETANCFASVVDCFLRVRRVKISPSMMINHAMALEKTTAKYPIKRVVVKNYTLPYAASKQTITGINTGVLPNRVVVGFLRTGDYDGTINSNPFNFRNYNISKLTLKVSSRALPYSSGLNFDFDKNQYLQGYNTLYQGLKEAGNDITYKDYKWGYTLFVFDLSPDLCSGEHFNLVKDGCLDLDIEFKEAHNESITALFYLEFDNIIEITKHRNILFDYQV